MSTVAEITEALSKLNDDELRKVEQALHAVYRQRSSGIIHDDAYGVWTEEDQVSGAAEVFAMLDKDERNEGGTPG